MAATTVHTLLLILFLLPSLSSATYTLPDFPIAKPDCLDHCGDIHIPFPFGTTESCYGNYSFWVTCNETYSPPKLFMQDSTIEIVNISLEGQLKVVQFIVKDCYSQNGTRIFRNHPYINLPRLMTVNNTANKFTTIGCDSYGYIYGRRRNGRNYSTGCIATCSEIADLEEGSCEGLGCCQITSIPDIVWSVNMYIGSLKNHTEVVGFNNCSYGFFVEESSFRFSPQNLTNLGVGGVEKLPMVVDWAIGWHENCESARENFTSYACKSLNSECYMPDNGIGYRCRCNTGYQGNPYLDINGCQDIDECKSPTLNNCERTCQNMMGGFKCSCQRGYYGDGKKGSGGCTRAVESLVFRWIAGILLGIIILMLTTCLFYIEINKRRLKKMKEKCFIRNGGILLEEKLHRKGRSPDVAKIFKYVELQRATNNFHSSKIIGKGGFGVVYEGFLAADNRLVAIKKSKEVDSTQIEQFINEVIVLSQINHRNVVKLLGCCLETQVPLLVYEFIDKGTLFEHLHIESKKRSLTWNLRLKIAIETANVLSYLHSAASPPIIHRDVKSANILLDHDYMAKVSDFGASRLVPMDDAVLATMVQGTHGYLDPEYMQTQQLTEKSDVYSFGVVLLELLTCMRVISNDRPEEDRNLAILFLRRLKQGKLFEIIDKAIMCDENHGQLIKVADIAKECLNVRGEDRPSMREVATELEGLKLGRKHSGAKHDQQVAAEEMKSFRDKVFDGIVSVDGYSTGTSAGYDSLKDYTVFTGGGR